MANIFGAEKEKIEEINIFIQAIEAGYITTIRSVVESKINYLKNKPLTDYIMDLIARLIKIKDGCKQ